MFAAAALRLLGQRHERRGELLRGLDAKVLLVLFLLIVCDLDLPLLGLEQLLTAEAQNGDRVLVEARLLVDGELLLLFLLDLGLTQLAQPVQGSLPALPVLVGEGVDRLLVELEALVERLDVLRSGTAALQVDELVDRSDRLLALAGVLVRVRDRGEHATVARIEVPQLLEHLERFFLAPQVDEQRRLRHQPVQVTGPGLEVGLDLAQPLRGLASQLEDTRAIQVVIDVVGADRLQPLVALLGLLVAARPEVDVAEQPRRLDVSRVDAEDAQQHPLGGVVAVGARKRDGEPVLQLDVVAVELGELLQLLDGVAHVALMVDELAEVARGARVGRVALQRLAIELHRLAGAALQRVVRRDVVVRPRILAVDVEDLAKGALGLLVALLLLVDDAQVVQRLAPARSRLERSLVFGLGLLEPIPLLVGEAQVVAKRRVIRVDREAQAEGLDRLVQLAPALVERAQVVVREHVPVVGLDRLKVRGDRLVDLAQVLEDVALVVEDVRALAEELLRLLHRAQRLLELPLLAKADGDVVERLRVHRVELERASEDADRLAVATGASEDDALQDMAGDRLGILLEHLVDEAVGGLVVPETERVARADEQLLDTLTDHR